MSINTRKKSRIDIRTSNELHEALTSTAQRQGTSVSETARRILEERLVTGKTAAGLLERLDRLENLVLRSHEKFRAGIETLLIVCGNLSPEDAKQLAFETPSRDS